MDQEERKNNRKSAMITGGIQVVFLVVLYFLVAWKEPYPPIPEFGVELSFGLEEVGRPSVPAATPVVENIVSEQPTEQPVEEVTEASEEVTEEPPETEDINSPDQQEVAEEEEIQPAEEENAEVVSEEVPLEAEETEVPAAVEEVTEEESEQEEVTLPAETTPSDDQGQADEEGQEGDPEAEIDERALYGNVTGEEGASLELSGWIWDFEPTPYDDSQETGKIVYKITIDAEGYIIESPIPIVSTVSPSVEKFYRQAVERLTFSKTSTYKTAPTSTGTITFVIKSK